MFGGSEIGEMRRGLKQRPNETSKARLEVRGREKKIEKPSRGGWLVPEAGDVRVERDRVEQVRDEDLYGRHAPKVRSCQDSV